MESLFSEVRVGFYYDEFDDCYTVDSWATNDGMEEGRVLATINPNTKEVDWCEETTQEERNDPKVQEAISEFIELLRKESK